MNTLLAGKQAAGSYAPATGIAPSAITGTAVITTDTRLSNARTPTAHTHAAADITSGTLAIARIPTGTTATTVCIGNDSRLSNSRFPTAHTHSADDITSGTLANARTTATNANTANAIVARDASGNIVVQDSISERISNDTNCGILQFRKAFGTPAVPITTRDGNTNLGILSFNGYSPAGDWTQSAAIVVNKVSNDAAQNPCGEIQIQSRSVNGNFASRLTINSGGNAVFSGTCSATTFIQTSDLNEKDNISYEFVNGLEKIKKLKPATFDFKGDGPKGNLGFIAQDVIKEIPDAITTYNKTISKNGIDNEVKRLGIKEGHLVAVLVKAVQELAARVEALEAK
jgi:hypothetical protein